jgi:hypothetical protein
MASLPAAAATHPADRRGAARSRLECAALLQLTVGNRSGMLWDLSTGGARFQTDNPPPVGMTALLKWHSHEAFCQVVWKTADACGIAFHRPLSPSLVDNTVQEEEARSGPVAAVGNIPLGQKRSRP